MKSVADRAMSHALSQPVDLPGWLGEHVRDWHAFDSTTVRLDDDLVDDFPGAGKYAALKVHKRFSIGVGATVGYTISPAREHDSKHLTLDESWRGCGLLADLGYASFKLLQDAERLDVRYVIRLKESWKPKVEAIAAGDVSRTFLKGAEFDALLDEVLRLTGPSIDADIRLGRADGGAPSRVVGVKLFRNRPIVAGPMVNGEPIAQRRSRRARPSPAVPAAVRYDSNVYARIMTMGPSATAPTNTLYSRHDPSLDSDTCSAGGTCLGGKISPPRVLPLDPASAIDLVLVNVVAQEPHRNSQVPRGGLPVAATRSQRRLDHGLARGVEPVETFLGIQDDGLTPGCPRFDQLDQLAVRTFVALFNEIVHAISAQLTRLAVRSDRAEGKDRRLTSRLPETRYRWACLDAA